MPQFFITSDHVLLLLLIPPYHTLSPRCETKPFYVGNFKINSQGYRFFITSYYALSLLFTPYHTLSHILQRKPFYVGNFKISFQAADFLLHLIVPFHALSEIITSYPLVWKGNHSIFGALQLILSRLTFYHNLLKVFENSLKTSFIKLDVAIATSKNLLNMAALEERLNKMGIEKID